MKKLLLILLIISALITPIFAQELPEYKEPDVTIWVYSPGVLIIIVDGDMYLAVPGYVLKLDKKAEIIEKEKSSI